MHNITKREVTGHYMPPVRSILGKYSCQKVDPELDQIFMSLVFRKYRGQRNMTNDTTELALAKYRLGKHYRAID